MIFFCRILFSVRAVRAQSVESSNSSKEICFLPWDDKVIFLPVFSVSQTQSNRLARGAMELWILTEFSVTINLGYTYTKILVWTPQILIYLWLYLCKVVRGSAQDSCSQSCNLLNTGAEILNVFHNYGERAFWKSPKQGKIKQNCTEFSNVLRIPKITNITIQIRWINNIADLQNRSTKIYLLLILRL